MTLLCVALAQGCDFIGDVSLGNNDAKGGSVATGGSGSATGGSRSGGSDSGGGDDSSGGSAPSGGTSNGGGSGSSSGGAGTAGAGEAGVPPGGSSSGGTGSGGAPQGGAAGSAAGASGAGALGGAGAAAGAGGASGANYGGAGGMASASYLGCTFVGGYDRVVVSKRDVANNRCLGLVLWDGHTESGDIQVPERWALEMVVVGPAEECPSRSGTRVEASVSGSLTFLDQSTGAGPMHVAVDATVAFAAGQPATGIERLIVESVDVRPACNAACLGAGPNPACNDNPALSSIHGRCTAAGTCVCNEGYELNPATGKCL